MDKQNNTEGTTMPREPRLGRVEEFQGVKGFLVDQIRNISVKKYENVEIIALDDMSPEEMDVFERKLKTQFDENPEGYKASSTGVDSKGKKVIDPDREYLANRATKEYFEYLVRRGLIIPGGKIFHLNDGAGPWNRFMLETGIADSIVSMEISEKMALLGWNTLPRHLQEKVTIIARNSADPFDKSDIGLGIDEYAETVTCTLGAMYWTDRQFIKVLKSVSGVLRPGGLFVLTVSSDKLAEALLGVPDCIRSQAVFDLPMDYGGWKTLTSFVLRSIERTEQMAIPFGFEVLEEVPEDIQQMVQRRDYYANVSPDRMGIALLSKYLEIYPYYIYCLRLK